MRIVIVYSSKFGNTERVALAMRAALVDDHEVDARRADELAGIAAGPVDLLLVGAPTHIHGLTGVGSIVRKVTNAGLHDVPAAAFDTRLPGSVAVALTCALPSVIVPVCSPN